jgi:SNF2 family DNA or RNA helicase
MLDLIQKALVKQGLEFVRIDGSKTEKARREAIARFRGKPNCGILLATIGSAGVVVPDLAPA